jgi:hypothetical protein
LCMLEKDVVPDPDQLIPFACRENRQPGTELITSIRTDIKGVVLWCDEMEEEDLWRRLRRAPRAYAGSTKTRQLVRKVPRRRVLLQWATTLLSILSRACRMIDIKYASRNIIIPAISDCLVTS